MKQPMLPADTYIVFNKTILNNEDSKIINMLYQPIVGSNAASLYFTLIAYLDKNEVISLEWTHHHLMTNMHLSLDEIANAREKLEAIGLIKTYLKTGTVNNYIYELYSPMPANEILNNPILNTSLLNSIGKIEFEKIVNYFKILKLDLKQYQNITVSFNDVFISKPTTQVGYIEDVKGYNYNELKYISNIDINDIISSIPEELINLKTISKSHKDLIYKISFIYNFSNEMMVDIIRQSLTEMKTIDKELLKTIARNYYQFENNGKLPSLLFKKQPEYLRTDATDTSVRAKAIYQFETTTPYDFLVSKNKGVLPPKSDLKIIEYLLIDLNMKPGVVNILIDYILKVNNNKLTRPYVETVASQWIKSNIETVEDAIKLIDKEKNKKVRTKKQEAKPEWIGKDIEKTDLSLEEQNELKNILSEFK